MTDQNPLADLADRIRDLTEPGTHIEAYRVRAGTNYTNKLWPSTHSSLLNQLRECAYDRAQTETEAADRDARTVPHLDIDAIDRLSAIEKGVAQWCGQYETESRCRAFAERLAELVQAIIALTPRNNLLPQLGGAVVLLTAAAARASTLVELDMRQLVGVAASRDGPEVRQLAHAASRWRTWCRIFAGWESRPARPRARCMHCDAPAGVVDDRPSGLRIRYDIRSAVCLTCDATWDFDTIGVLAAHIAATDSPAARLLEPTDRAKSSPIQNRGGRG